MSNTSYHYPRPGHRGVTLCGRSGVLFLHRDPNKVDCQACRAAIAKALAKKRAPRPLAPETIAEKYVPPRASRRPWEVQHVDAEGLITKRLKGYPTKDAAELAAAALAATAPEGVRLVVLRESAVLDDVPAARRTRTRNTTRD